MRHEFVQYIPSTLEEGVLYVSVEYKTAAHLCACGCQQEVITPLSPTDWELSFNGNSITLRPSIGNWDFSCRSHYFITKNSIDWAGDFTKEQIRNVKRKDKINKDTYYETESNKVSEKPNEKSKGLPERLFSFFSKSKNDIGLK